MTEAKTPQPFPGVEQFLMDAPLYVPFRLDDESWEQVIGIYADDYLKFDGHCPDCGRDATFDRSGEAPHNEFAIRSPGMLADGFFGLVMDCARDVEHQHQFWILKQHDSIHKVGQWPTPAAIL